MLKNLALACLLVPAAYAADADAWKSRAIYQLVTDRFARSDNAAAPCDTSQRKFCGGSYQGIISHLDYIQNMGFDAIWISPVVENVNGTTAYGEAYHGYWTSNINGLNSNFGSASDLTALSDALHARGMYLMFDVVVNHMVTIPNNSSGTQVLDYSQITPFNTQSDFHTECFISDYNNQTNVEQCWLGDNNLPLEDLNTEDSNIVSTMNTWIKNLIQTYKVDGLRIDTLKHVRKDFWPEFAKSAGVFTIGEVLIDDPSYAGPYTQVIDSVLDYPNYFQLVAAFGNQTGNLSALVDVVTRSQNAYGNAVFNAGSFLENQDQPRFQSITQDKALVKNAMAWPFVQDGIPILYYGQEQGYTGNGDPANREALWPTAFDTSKDLVSYVKTLNAARKAAISSNKNFLTTKMQFISQSDQSSLAVSKPPLLTLLTNTGSNGTSTPSWSIPSSSKLFTANEKLVELLTCNTVQADSSGGLSVQSKGGMPQVWMPVSSLTKNSTLCPTVLASNTKSGSLPIGSPASALFAGTLFMLLGFIFSSL